MTRPDPVPVPPGGERQDPREWTIRVCPHGARLAHKEEVGWVHAGAFPVMCDRAAEAQSVRVVEASSVPVGGAPREKVADALYGHLGDFSTYEKCLELADAAIAAMWGGDDG